MSTEEALRQSEARFKAAVEAVQGILWTNNAAGEMEGEQPGWSSLTGQTRSDYQGFGWTNAIHPDDAQPTVDAWNEAVRNRQTFVFEHRVRLKQGHYELFSVRAVPVLGNDGEIIEWVGVHTNINAQVQAKRRAEQSQQQLLTLFEQSPTGIAIISGENLTFRMVNPFYATLVGRTLDALIDKPLFEAIPEIQGQGFDVLLREVIRTGTPYIASEVAVDVVRNGTLETIYVDLTYQPWRDITSEQTVGVFVIAIDVTQQVRSRKLVEASEAKLKTIIETAPVAIGLFMGRDLIVDSLNQTFIDMVGKEPDIIGKPLREAMPELVTENQPFLQVLDDVYTSGKTFQVSDTQAKILKGGVMTNNYYDVSFTPLFNEAGQVYAILDIGVDVTERKANRDELTQQNTYLENALEIADLGMFNFDIASHTSHVSENVRQWFGLASQTESMDVILNVIHPDDLETVQTIIRDAINSPENAQHDIIYRIINPITHQTHHIRSFGKAHCNAEGPYAFTGILQNVTPQIESRRQLEASESKFRGLIEQAPIATGLFVGRDMIIEVANETILRYWDKDQRVIGLPLIEALPEIEGQPFMGLLEQVYTTGVAHHEKAARADLVVGGKLGTYYFDYTYEPIRNSEGEVFAIMDVAVDVTDEVHARRKLEDAQATLRGAVELAELGTWRLNIQQGTIKYSARFMEWLGFSDDTVELDEAYNPLPDSHRQSFADALQASWQPGGTGFYENEHPIINRLTGQTRIIHARAEVQYDLDGKPVLLNGTARDVTQERRQQQELERQVGERTAQLQELINDLERSNQNLQQFAYVASHDLQEPLRKIQSFGDLLKNRHGDALGDGADYLNRMQTAAGRMSALIKDLLTYSRISTRQEVSNPVWLNTVVQSVLSDLELVVTESQAIIEVAPLPNILGDRSQLNQLFQNLISNALKFRRQRPDGTFEPPHIRIAVERVPAQQLPPTVRPARVAQMYQRIDVSDNGIGFDQKYADRIFQVFQRLHGKNEFAGTGIGLAICEKVAANHGGAITATSEPGQGATFSLYLPE